MAQPSSAPAAGIKDPAPAPAPAPARSESSKTAINTYDDDLKKLANERRQIEKEKAEILNEIKQLNLSNLTPAPPAPDLVPADVQVIAFIKALERGYEFFKFKDHLERNVRFIKHSSDSIKCLKSLVKYNKVQDIFNNLTFQDILDAVQERILDLQIEKDKLAINNFSKNSKEDKKRFTLSKYKANGADPVLIAIFKLLFQVHENRYVMDEDPNVELDLMKKHNPDFHKHFIRGLREKFSEKTVKIHSVPVEFEEREVKELFQGCGRIESIKFVEFEGYWCKFAEVTFKTSEGAKLAPILMKPTVFSVQPVLEPPECRTYSGKERRQALRMYKMFRDPTTFSKESSSSSNGK